MKLAKSKLRQIIKEEFDSVITEQRPGSIWDQMENLAEELQTLAADLQHAARMGLETRDVEAKIGPNAERGHSLSDVTDFIGNLKLDLKELVDPRFQN